MKLYARQGDLVIEQIQMGADAELIPRNDIVFAGDSSGHRHHLLGRAAIQFPTTPGTTRFRIETPTQLVHEKPDGHRSVELLPGDYEIRPLRERGNGLDRAVED